MHKPIALLLVAAVVAAVVAGCRGEISTKPPVHIVPNMDFQEKLKAQSESKFAGWTDGRGMRLPVYGTVARGSLRELDTDAAVARLHTFKKADGSFVTENPLPKSRAVIDRGRERYEIHCAVCHGFNGRGLGIVGRKLPVKPPSFVKKADDDDPLTRHKPEVLEYADGQLFNIITNGFSTMQPYRFQVDADDRWAIVHYIRVLQLRAN